jgi:hypothetical protein
MTLFSRSIRTAVLAAFGSSLLCLSTSPARAECPSQAKGTSGIQVTLRVTKTACGKTAVVPATPPTATATAPAAPVAPVAPFVAPPAAPIPGGANRVAPRVNPPEDSAPRSGESPPPAAEPPAPGVIEPDPAKLPTAEPRRDAVIATSGDRSSPAVAPAVNRAGGNATAAAGSTSSASSTSEAPAAPKVQRGVPEVTIGAEVTIRSPRLGTTPGKVQLRIGEQVLACDVTAWMDNRVTLVVPAFETVEDREATLEVSRADGRVYRKLPVKLLAEDAEVTVTR